MKRLILASASPRRREILELGGFSFAVQPGTKEEIRRGTTPAQTAEYLAIDKAEEAAESCQGECLILGADTIVVCDGQIMGKPKEETDAYRMLLKLQGHVHQVYTGAALLDKKEDQTIRYVFHEKTDVWVYPMSDDEIYAYIATKDPMDKAGAYGIQGAFGKYIERINGDYLNVVGLPLARLYQEMKKHNLL